MLRSLRSFLIVFILLTSPLVIELWATGDAEARELVAQAVRAMGGSDAFYALEDVQYEYRYYSPERDVRNTSIERYIFDGELSWARYSEYGSMGLEGEVTESYNGSTFLLLHNGKALEDTEKLNLTRFMRKTNYYWFAMMFKLLDPGLIYKYEGSRTIDGRQYDLVKISFEDQVGDAQDTYLLYINKSTKLVDQFLFTVMAFGMREPLLMQVQYQTIKGLKIPAKRKYVKSNWQGEIIGTQWTTAEWDNIRFSNGFDRRMFTTGNSE